MIINTASQEQLKEINSNLIALDDKVEELESDKTYTRTEREIGTWIDGKPIYRKCYTGNLASNVDYINIDNTLKLNTIDCLINSYGFGTLTNGIKASLNGYLNATVFSDVAVQTDGLYISYGSAFRGGKYTVIVEYTKN